MVTAVGLIEKAGGENRGETHGRGNRCVSCGQHGKGQTITKLYYSQRYPFDDSHKKRQEAVIRLVFFLKNDRTGATYP